MIILHSVIRVAIAAVFAVVGFAGTATAASVADFYKGKKIRILISSGAGGGYDQYARVMGRHLGRHIPGKPDMIPQNMPGAGGMKMMNFAYNKGAKDGTVMFTLHQNLPMYQAMGARGVRFDARKLIGIGRLTQSNELIAAWHTAPVKNLKDAYKMQLIVGSTGASSNSTVYPHLARNMLGLKFKVISGYNSGSEVTLAMERGEIQGFGSYAWASMKVRKPEYMSKKLITPLVQFGLKREKVWPNTPLATELAKTPEDKAAMEVVAIGPLFGRSYWMAPGVPKARVKAVRDGFQAMLKDPKFLKDFNRQKMLLRPATGPELEALVTKLFAAPQASLDRLKGAMVKSGGGRCQDYTAFKRCRKKKKKKKK